MIITLNKYYRTLFSKSNKNTKRGIWIFLNAFNSVSLPVFNLLLSSIIIKRISLDFWGEYVSLSLVVNLSSMVLGWGNKEFLLREFSRNPFNIASGWQISIVQRFLIFLPLIVSLFLFFDYSYYRISLLFFWIVGSFLYKSLDVLVLYKRAFSFSSFAEIAGYSIIILLAAFCNIGIFNVDLLILILASMSFLKFLIGIYFFRHEIFPNNIVFNFSFKTNTLLLSIPYFLPSLAGLLQGKIDLYCVAYLLSPHQLGEYQIFMNLLTVPHLAATFIVMPFIKNIYRLPFGAIKKIIWRLTRVGLIASLPSIIIIYFIVQEYYNLQLSLWMYAFAYIQLIPFFIYFIKVHMLFKYDKQYITVWISLATGLFGFCASLLLIPYWNIKGAIIANTITQWITLLLFNRYANRYAETNRQ